ncbi:F-box protein At3g12350-like [Aristolochia californica]|uniref:F-box protein At3g12350-like n=1 Tax=Aristolochia californica TaxID=171875 RepID=UPI0035D9D843
MAILDDKEQNRQALVSDSESPPFPFVDFPEDVQLCVLSFLSSSDISAFSSTSKRFNSFCRNDGKLWFFLCDRLWGHKTQIRKWGNGKASFKSLYRTLIKWENLIGFWRRIGHEPPLVFFEWGPSFITGSRISPSKTGGYQIFKTPFLWMGLSTEGEPLSYLDPDKGFDFAKTEGELGLVEADLVQVRVNFIGRNHFVVEGNLSFESSQMGSRRSEEDLGTLDEIMGVDTLSPGSPPDVLTSEIYQYFANLTSPGAERASRRQRKKEREKNGRRKFEIDHYVKIVNSSLTSSRPLQGLWKGISDDLNLNFYLLGYDDIGGIVCRKMGASSEPLCGFSPVFWTPNPIFLESPFSKEEEDLYEERVHIRPQPADETYGYSLVQENEVVSRILYINSSYDLVIPDLTSSPNPRQVEGRIWQYKDGTFGYGFLRDNFIVDLKHIALHGRLLDAVEQLSNGPRV